MSEADLSPVLAHMWSKVDALLSIHQGACDEGHTEAVELLTKSVSRLLHEIKALEAAACRL
jgi:hypothetical protein